MAGDVKIANISAALSTSAGGSTNFTKPDFGTSVACRITISFDAVDDVGVAVQSKVSVGFSDFTNNFCITHQDEDGSAKVDSDCRKSNTKAYVVLDVDGSVLFSGTATATIDGVTLTHTAGEAPSSGFFASVEMYGGADIVDALRRSAINSSQDDTATIAHSGFTDGNDKLIFFIGVDISAEDNSGTGINNSFGVCHITGSDAGGWTFVQRALGWTSDHNNTRGSPSSIISTDRVLDIITEAGAQDWGLEVTGFSNSGGTIEVTTRDAGAGVGMEVYSLAFDLDDRKAKVGSVDSPTSGATFSITGMGFKPQSVGMLLTDLDAEDVIETADAQAGVIGISSNTGSGEESCHSWYNAEDTVAADTANLFRSRVIDLRDDDTSQTLQDHSHLSFDSGGVTHTVNSEDETVAKKWGFWAIEEAAVSLSVNLGLATEADIALAMTHAKAVLLGLPVETDIAFPMGKFVEMGLALEADTALVMAPDRAHELGIALETDIALAMAHAKAVNLGLASELDVALAITADRLVALGIALEADTALAITPQQGVDVLLGLPVEVDTADAMTALRAHLLGLPVTVDIALSMQTERTHTLGLPSETDVALALTHSKSVALGIALETDIALTMEAIGGGVGGPVPTGRLVRLVSAKRLIGIERPTT